MFDELKRIPAAEIAEASGLRLQRRGSRLWTCCPLHGEKTPSMCFYEDGGWYCFGCHAGGDAVALYAALNGVSMGEAARALAGEQDIETRPRPNARRFLEAWRNEQWDKLCHASRAAQDVLRSFPDPEKAWDSPLFVTALQARAVAEMRLDRLWAANMEELIEMYREEVAGNGKVFRSGECSA